MRRGELIFTPEEAAAIREAERHAGYAPPPPAGAGLGTLLGAIVAGVGHGLAELGHAIDDFFRTLFIIFAAVVLVIVLVLVMPVVIFHDLSERESSPQARETENRLEAPMPAEVCCGQWREGGLVSNKGQNGSAELASNPQGHEGMPAIRDEEAQLGIPTTGEIQAGQTDEPTTDTEDIERINQARPEAAAQVDDLESKELFNSPGVESHQCSGREGTCSSALQETAGVHQNNDIAAKAPPHRDLSADEMTSATTTPVVPTIEEQPNHATSDSEPRYSEIVPAEPELRPFDLNKARRLLGRLPWAEITAQRDTPLFRQPWWDSDVRLRLRPGSVYFVLDTGRWCNGAGYTWKQAVRPLPRYAYYRTSQGCFVCTPALSRSWPRVVLYSVQSKNRVFHVRGFQRGTNIARMPGSTHNADPNRFRPPKPKWRGKINDQHFR